MWTIKKKILCRPPGNKILSTILLIGNMNTLRQYIVNNKHFTSLRSAVAQTSLHLALNE